MYNFKFSETFRFIFPEIVLDNIALQISHPHLTIWSSLLNSPMRLDSELGRILELMGKCALMMRIGEKMTKTDSDKHFYNLFPFLPEDSFVGSEKVERTIKLGSLPKFVSDERSTKIIENSNGGNYFNLTHNNELHSQIQRLAI